MGMNSSLGARLFPQFNYVSAAVAAATTAVVTRTPLLEVTFILGLNKYFIHLRYSLSSWLFFFFFFGHSQDFVPGSRCLRPNQFH